MHYAFFSVSSTLLLRYAKFSISYVSFSTWLYRFFRSLYMIKYNLSLSILYDKICASIFATKVWINNKTQTREKVSCDRFLLPYHKISKTVVSFHFHKQWYFAPFSCVSIFSLLGNKQTLNMKIQINFDYTSKTKKMFAIKHLVDIW